MAEVVPTLLASSLDDYQERLEHVQSFAKRLHVDVSDGVFTPTKTVGLDELEPLSGATVDLHLMLAQPDEQLALLTALDPDLVIFHFESQGDHQHLIEQLHQRGLRAGLAIKPETRVAAVAPLLSALDHLLVFTGHLGFNGGTFQGDCLAKIKQAKAINPHLEVAVDGGINAETAKQAVAAGAMVLDCGSFIQEASDPEAAYHQLAELKA